MGDSALDRAERAGQHREGAVDAGEFEIDDRGGSHVLAGRVLAFEFGDQEEYVGPGQRHDDRALVRAEREAGRVEHVVAGIEQQ
jgi:hypothetical protein